MPRPITLKLVLKILLFNGFVFISQRGSHAKFKKESSPKRIVILKMSKKEIPYGTFRYILLQSGLKDSDFRK